MRFIYSILIAFAAPVVAFVAWLRGMRDPARRERLADRFGSVNLQIDKPVIWLHAASMGEVQAGVTLVRRLAEQYPRHQIVVTTMTTTGAARVRAVFGDTVRHAYLPYDLRWSVKRFLARVRPQIAIIVETELWPNLLRECTRNSIPVIVASGRISPRTEARYRYLKSLFLDALSDGVVIAAQTQADAVRFASLGATQVLTTGNIKFDIEIAHHSRQMGTALRAKVARQFIWVAGSTHEGEELAVIEAHRKLLMQYPDALLILAPRHPQRFEVVRNLLIDSQLKFVSRESNAAITRDTAIYLVDKLGELLNMYAAADVAFVGGSLVPIGGHNLLEPAALSVPVICGPHMSNNLETLELLQQANALIVIDSAGALGDAVVSLAMDQQRRIELGQRAFAVVNGNRGAVDRVMELVAQRMSLV